MPDNRFVRILLRRPLPPICGHRAKQYVSDIVEEKLSRIVFFVVGLAILLALSALDFWLDRVITKALFKLIDRLPPYRPGGRYRSQSEPRKYALFRRKRTGR